MLSVVTVVRDLARLREITAVLIRHGFGEIVARMGLGRGRRAKPGIELGGDEDDVTSEQPAPPPEMAHISVYERIRLVLQELGPTFIKLGQIMSSRADILPPELIVELKKLQDNVPPVAFEDIRLAIEESLGAPIDELFVKVDKRPLAAASIGQVHRAILATPEGEREVVIKVQRPGVAITVARDLELLHRMAAALERAIPETKIYSPIGLVQQFDRSITNELDFAIEADNAERFAVNFAGSAEVRFPKVYRSVSSKQVITLEYFDGLKLNAAVEAGANGSVMAKRAVGVVIKMVFEDGFFHADPHPGNIIILGPTNEPVIGLIDVGMVGRLSPELRDRTIDLMVAAVRKDSYAVADALYAIGHATKKVDMRKFRAEVSFLAEKYLGRPLKEIDLSGMIRDLISTAIKYGIEIPTDFMLVGKAIMTIEGIGKQLDPNLDVFGEAAPYIFDLLRKRYSPQRIGHDLRRGLEQLTRIGAEMPQQIREILDDIRLGRLVIQTKNSELPRAADRLGRRIFSALIIASLVLAGAYLVASDGGRIAGYSMISLAACLWAIHTLQDLRRG